MVYDILNEDNIISNFLSGFVNKLGSTNKPESYYLRGSISNFSKDLIMTFPTMCDNSLSPSTASMLSRANERNIVSMLQMLFASVQFNGQNGAEILSRIHKNIKVSYGMDDYINALEGLPQVLSKFENAQVDKAAREMVQELKLPKKSLPVSSFSETSLNEYTVQTIYGNTVIQEARPNKGNPRWNDLSDTEIENLPGGDNELENEYRKAQFSRMLDDWEKDDEMHNIKMDQLRADSANKRSSTRYNTNKNAREDESHKWQRRAAAQQYANNASEELRKKEAERRAIGKNAREIEKHGWEREKQGWDRQKFANDLKAADRREELDAWQRSNYAADAISKQLLDTDIKKANEMMPSLMIIRYNEMDADGKIFDQKPFVAGVKSRLIAVDPVDIIDRISAKNKTKVNFLNLIRATTGEIKLVKDFMLCVDQAKIDARNGVKKGEAAKMWKVLESRSIKNNWNKIIRKGNDASAITTLVINQETANILKKEYGFDLEKPANAKAILDAYNLLGIMIADESVEVVKIIYTGNDMFEQQAYSYLQKESNDNSYKKVINLIGSMNRR